MKIDENMSIKDAYKHIEEAKEIKKLLNIQEEQQISEQTTNLFSRYVGKYVICRSRNEGVNAGYVVELDDTGVILKEARRLYYHKPINKNISWYEGVAISGISEDSRVGPAVEKIIIEDYSLTICDQLAEKSIKEIKNNEQS
jgi:hypothetical protein